MVVIVGLAAGLVVTFVLPEAPCMGRFRLII